MEKISKLNTSVKTGELNSLAKGIILEYSQNDWSTDIILTNIFTELVPLNESLTSAINRIKAESDLEEKDAVRDEKVRGINYLVLGFMHHPNAEIKAAAEKVNGVFSHFGVDIVNEGYDMESSLINSLVLDLESEDLQSSIALLPGLGEIIVELRTAQTAFEEAQSLFQNERVAEGNMKSATEIKKEILPVINDKLVVYLRAMLLGSIQSYLQFAGKVEVIISDINEKIKRRQSSGGEEPQVNG